MRPTLRLESDLRRPSVVLLGSPGGSRNALVDLLSDCAETVSIESTKDLADIRPTDFDALFYLPGDDTVSWQATLLSVQNLCPDLPVIVLSGPGAMEECAEALREGAFDFLVPPFGGHRLLAVIEQARATSEARAWHSPVVAS